MKAFILQVILARVGDERDSREAQTSWSIPCPWLLPLMEEAKFYSADLSSRCWRIAGANFFFLFVSTFLFHFTNIYYVISLRLEVYQYTDCTFLCIYKAQHYRTLQTHLIQTFLYVAPSVHKCPQKYYKHEINPMSSCMTELVEPHWSNRLSFHLFILSCSPFSPPLHLWPLHLSFSLQHSLSITNSLLSLSSHSVSLNFSLPSHQALADFSHTHKVS